MTFAIEEAVKICQTLSKIHFIESIQVGPHSPLILPEYMNFGKFSMVKLEIFQIVLTSLVIQDTNE